MPRKTMKTENEIIKNRTSGMWLVEHKVGSYALHALGEGRNLYWRRLVSLDVRCPHCGAKMVETSGAMDNQRLGTFCCPTCAQYGQPDRVEDKDGIDWDKAMADLHARAERMMPKANSKATNAVKEKAADGTRITLSRETEETLRRMSRNTPSSQRPGYSVITMGISAHVDRLQALNRLGGCASDKDLRAEIAKVRHYNNI